MHCHKIISFFKKRSPTSLGTIPHHCFAQIYVPGTGWSISVFLKLTLHFLFVCNIYFSSLSLSLVYLDGTPKSCFVHLASTTTVTSLSRLTVISYLNCCNSCLVDAPSFSRHHSLFFTQQWAFKNRSDYVILLYKPSSSLLCLSEWETKILHKSILSQLPIWHYFLTFCSYSVSPRHTGFHSIPQNRIRWFLPRSYALCLECFTLK